MIRFVFVLLMAGISAGSIAQALDFSVFSIEVAADWTHTVEQVTAISDTEAELITIFRPDGDGTLKLLAYGAPDAVDRERLRALTNVDGSITLSWQAWGEFSGYEHSYIDRESFFKQWWLLNEETILWITYESEVDESQTEVEAVDMMVNSIMTATN